RPSFRTCSSHSFDPARRSRAYRSSSLRSHSASGVFRLGRSSTCAVFFFACVFFTWRLLWCSWPRQRPLFSRRGRHRCPLPSLLAATDLSPSAGHVGPRLQAVTLLAVGRCVLPTFFSTAICGCEVRTTPGRPSQDRGRVVYNRYGHLRRGTPF